MIIRPKSQLAIDLRIFEDAHYPFLFGGSKARKLRYIMADANRIHANAIVSTGSASSNHARDCALACAQLGWKCKLIIHDKEDYSQSNLFLMRIAGAELSFCDLSEVSTLMNGAMDEFRSTGLLPYYIWGGGHSVFGAKALMNAVSDFFAESGTWIPDYVLVASGTGGTQAGLHVGFAIHNPKTEVIGISVAREKERGKKAVMDAVVELGDHSDIDLSCKKQPTFLDDWRGNGYGTLNDHLLWVINDAAKYGIITDPTYTGKAMCALYDLVENGTIPRGSKVLFWHTGGLLNLMDRKIFF
jgi:D-cysteine desulfhydrase